MSGIKFFLLLFISGSFFNSVNSQTIGGSSVFNFLDLPSSAQISGLGGMNTSQQSQDVSLGFYNPALLRDSMDKQLSVGFNSLFAGVKNYNAFAAIHHKPTKVNFAVGVNFIDYGRIDQTDASGNIFGEFHPVDYSVHVSASAKYNQRWFYGASLKFINSIYGAFTSNAIAVDFGANYLDGANGLQLGFLARNMGAQLTSYNNDKEDLPFDLQIGISKKLESVPIQLSVTVHHLHQFDIRYADSTLEDFQQSNFLNKISRHFVLAAQFYPHEKIELSAAYNFLRGADMKLINASTGFGGLSLGIGAVLGKLQLRYSRAFYQAYTAYNQLGINFNLKNSNF